MKNFKITIFMMILVMLMAGSAVSAADLDDSSDAGILADNSIDETISTDAAEEVEAAEDAEVLADGDNNFTSLQNLIDTSGNNITLDKDYARVAGDSDIEINKNLTIDGQGKYTIDANKLGRVFLVNAGNTLTLKGITLVNGSSAGNGGAILMDSNTNLNIKDSTFINNNAAYGGAIFVSTGNANITATFTGNNATVDGSAVYISTDGKAKITDSKFENNTAKNGTVYNKGALTVNNNTFDEEAGIVSETPVTKPGSNVTIGPIANVTYGSDIVITYEIVNITDFGTINVVDVNDPEKLIEINTTVYGKITVVDVLPVGTYRVSVHNGESDNFAESEANKTFQVVKANANLQVNAKVNEFGIIEIEAIVDKKATGEITFKVINESGVVVLEGPEEIISGSAKFAELTVLPKGKYNYTVEYVNDNYNTTTYESEAPLVISRTNATLEVYNVTVEDFGRIVLLANVTKGAAGTVTYLFINLDTNETRSINITVDENGKADFDEITTFNKGNYKISIWYNGDANYYATVPAEESANVDKTAPILDVYKVTVNEYGQIVVLTSLNFNDATGNVTYLFTNVATGESLKVDIPVDNGTANYDELNSFEKAEYKISIWYNGDANYYATVPAEESASVTKTVPVLEVSNITVNDFGHIIILANVTKGATGKVTFLFVNDDTGKNSTVDAVVDNGTVKFDDVVDLGRGHYSIVAKYNGDANYYATMDIKNETVLTKDHINSTYEAVVTFNNVAITIKFPANATGNLTVFYPSGANKTMPINSAVVIDETFDNGAQWVLVTYPGDANYYSFDTYNITFFVKASSFISAKNVNVVYLNNGQVTVTLTDNNDGKGNNPIANAPVTITLNGKTYQGTTNSQGIATITIAANLVPKTYSAKVAYAGTGTSYGDDATFTFTVKKAASKITAKKKTFKAKTKTKKYTITLKNNKGQAIKKVQVTIKIGKKTFKAKTNSKGKATFKIKKFTKRGKYTAKVTFKGNQYYNMVTKKVKITIKK